MPLRVAVVCRHAPPLYSLKAFLQFSFFGVGVMVIMMSCVMWVLQCSCWGCFFAPVVFDFFESGSVVVSSIFSTSGDVSF
jgi:hypothetical protein